VCKKRVLLTGYNGFVGRYLFRSLTEYEVVILGRKKQANTKNFFEFELGKSLISNEAFKDVQVLIHLAARVHIMNDVSSDPITEFRFVNTQGTLNLAKQAAQAGVKRFIFVSSIKVNGESTTEGHPFNSSDRYAPEDPYGISKAEAEMQLIALGKETGMEIVIIRPPLVYGEGVKANFASLMKLVGKGLPLPFRSISNNKRSLVSVYNLVDLIKVCIVHPSAANQTFLVSDDNDLSTAEMVALMAKVQGKVNLSLPVPVCCFNLAGKVFGKQSVVDRLVGSLQVDIEHTKKTLNWQPPYSVEDGFKLSANRA
jgi:nucleoside-diphosphate-sugar epimerase